MKLTDFPILTSVLSERSVEYRAKHEEALCLLSEGLEAGEIANVHYKDMVKFYLNRAFETMWRVAVQDRKKYNHDIRSFTFDGAPLTAAEQALENLIGSGCPQPHLTTNYIAKLEKSGLDTPYTQAMLAVLTEFKPIAEGIKTLKDKVVKRQPKAPEDLKAKYTAPEASTRAIAQVRDILMQITQDAYDRLYASLLEDNRRRVKRYIEITNELRALCPDYKRPASQEIRECATKLNETRSSLMLPGLRAAIEIVENGERPTYSGFDFREERLVADHEAVIAKATQDVCDDIRDTFVYKNLAKIDSILEAKGDFEKIEINGYDVSLSGLEGTLRLTFKDSAAFTIKNSVVYVVNSYGTKFFRWPLTFHNVIKSDGTAMKQPSEEKMNTEFVGKAA
jgi:hypothetical protein